MPKRHEEELEMVLAAFDGDVIEMDEAAVRAEFSAADADKAAIDHAILGGLERAPKASRASELGARKARRPQVSSRRVSRGGGGHQEREIRSSFSETGDTDNGDLSEDDNFED